MNSRILLAISILLFSSVAFAADNISRYNPTGSGHYFNTYDATANDSDKSFTVPTGVTWDVQWLHVILATTATVGNRQLFVTITDDDGTDRFDIAPGVVQAASLTRHYGFFQGIYRETSFVGDELQVPIPVGMVLHPGWVIQVHDANAVDAAADDMTVSIQVIQRPD